MRLETTVVAVAVSLLINSATSQFAFALSSDAETLLQNDSGPGDSRIMSATAGLGLVRLQQKKYQEAEALLKEAVEISLKPDRPLEQDRRLGDNKQKWMLALAVICLKTGRKNEVKEWLTKTKTALHYPAIESSFNSAVDYALVEMAAGLTTDAAVDIGIAEAATSKKPSSASHNYEIIAELWKRNGNEQKYAEALKKLKEIRDERSSMSSSRVSVMNNGARHMMPPLPDSGLRFYYSMIASAARRAWAPPKGATGKRVEISFKVSKTGDVSDLNIAASSGNKALDESALDAVRRAAPFRALPENYKDNIDVRISFDAEQAAHP